MKTHDCATCKVKDCVECANCERQEAIIRLLRPPTKRQVFEALKTLRLDAMLVPKPA